MFGHFLIVPCWLLWGTIKWYFIELDIISYTIVENVHILFSQLICSYVLWPFAFVMGIDAADCRKVAELIGFKTFINEFVAYTELGTLIKNRKLLEAYDGPWKWVNGDILLEKTGKTLLGGIISVSRSSEFFYFLWF